ncbi:putative ankyrin repeat protein RF_0381 isoform X2 [Sitodiplosis mosellana]|uniref:putative ankyrin repeat protein RF_0381 isoform X2 n=1 Tax=Sitodiplosis mosellana TaxID=263140 RepID=UPI00244505B7|nr:putative ankyrin repeat protein RF_0381 isoform X2 [Sitodiplosis mosellana]
MFFSFLTALLFFGSNIFDSGAEIEGGRWNSVIVDCIRKQAYYGVWKNALDEAVKEGDVKGTEWIAKYCVKDPKDLEDPLLKMAGYTHTDYARKGLIVKILIDNGVNVSARSSYTQQTALHLSTHKWGHDIAKVLIEHGADVNARDTYGNNTPLHLAASYGKFGLPNIIKLLIENGADVNAKNERGDVPLHETAYIKDDLARAIIENAKDIDLNVKNYRGETPLTAAIRWHSPKVAKLLIERGADVDELDENGNTLLHQVLNNHNIGREATKVVVKALIDHGVDVNAQNNDGDTPLHFTQEFWVEKEIADMLIRGGANINIRNKNGTLPHHHFSDDELKLLNFFADLKEDAARALNESGIDINAGNNEERTALFGAIDYNQTDAARILLENGADGNNVLYKGLTPIQYAAYCCGNADIVRVLIENGANVDASNNTRMTALAWAAEKGYANVAKVLIEHGANINCRGYNQETPLHIAVKKTRKSSSSSEQIDIVKTLIEMGADLDAEDEDGRTPLFFARFWAYRNDKIAAFLKEAKVKRNEKRQ